MKAIRIIACVILLLALGVGAVLIFTPFGLALRQNPGRFDRGKLEEVVARVRSMAPAAGEESRFRLDDPSDPASLRRIEPDETFARGQNAGNVWATVTPDGALKVVIQTRDLGHAGEYGFAYSDAALSSKPFGSDWFILDVPGRLNLVLPKMQIDDHWWKVLYNLD
ncbi:MAG: hypothetical protein HKN82_16400 [Akkermansiaceae bacterium]|nr:hypothetical protein [Akkermansiaceae bacterium]NNM31160.1 hypothetical protein [Akkermansiaceae bacterium]